MRLRSLILSAALLALPFPLMADTIYTYTGDPFTGFSSPSPYTTSDFVSGSFTLSTPLAANLSDYTITPTSFDFSDGVNTATPADTWALGFTVSTDANGNITQWAIGFGLGTSLVPAGQFQTADLGSIVGDFANDFIGPSGDEYAGNSVAGTRTESTTTDPPATPEPSTITLLGTGLLGLFGIARRKLRSTPFNSTASL
jgi:hypothetical protein